MRPIEDAIATAWQPSGGELADQTQLALATSGEES
jgi:hypothetical protein